MKGDADQEEPLLELRGLTITFRGRGSTQRAVDGIDLAVGRGRVLALVGESGSGKSATALAVMRMLPDSAQVHAETLRFDGVDLLGLEEAAMTRLRGDRLAMIFQEPMTALNPVFTVGEQIAEVLIEHRAMNRAAARAEALALLRKVQVPSPEARLSSYPHQLSGGLRQRVVIAMALACSPQLLIADEPTTALDVTIQAQILALLDALRRELGSSVLLITHNLGVVAEIADDVAVMYAGRIVEQAPVRTLFDDPRHPYTLALLAAIPRASDVGQPLAAIEGHLPGPGDMRVGCGFAPRCPFASRLCHDQAPPLVADASARHAVACWHAPIEVMAS